VGEVGKLTAITTIPENTDIRFAGYDLKNSHCGSLALVACVIEGAQHTCLTDWVSIKSVIPVEFSSGNSACLSNNSLIVNNLLQVRIETRHRPPSIHNIETLMTDLSLQFWVFTGMDHVVTFNITDNASQFELTSFFWRLQLGFDGRVFVNALHINTENNQVADTLLLNISSGEYTVLNDGYVQVVPINATFEALYFWEGAKNGQVYYRDSTGLRTGLLLLTNS